MSIKLDSSVIDCRQWNISCHSFSFNFYDLQLEEIDLSENSLMSFPDEVSHLTCLAKLNVSKNNLEEFPKELCLVTCLRDLDISGNLIADIPFEFKHVSCQHRWCGVDLLSFLAKLFLSYLGSAMNDCFRIWGTGVWEDVWQETYCIRVSSDEGPLLEFHVQVDRFSFPSSIAQTFS